MGRDEYGECDMVAWLRWLHEGKNGTAERVLGGMRRIMNASHFFSLFLSVYYSILFGFFLLWCAAQLAQKTTIVTSPLPGAQELYIDGLHVVFSTLQVLSF